MPVWRALGASRGGFVAQGSALSRPELVAGLVLVCTGHGGRGQARMWAGAMNEMLGPGVLNHRRAVRRGSEGATSPRYRAENPEESERIVQKRPLRLPLAGLLSSLGDGRGRFDNSGDVRREASPTLVIHGAEDRYVGSRYHSGKIVR